MIVKDGKFLMTKRDDSKKTDKGSVGFNHVWQIPGGGLEFGESVEDCVRREHREELGVETEIISLIPKLYHDVRQKVWHGLIIAFICRLKNPDAHIMLNEEASEYRWYTIDEIKQLKMLPFCVELAVMAEKMLKE